MTRLSEIFNVNHFIVSQVNPHVAPFMSCDDYPMATSNPKPSWGAKIVNLAMAEAMHRMAMVAEIGLFKTSLTKAKAVLSQKYTGDITILPEIPLGDYGILLKNPTPEFMHRSTLCGQRATWPKLSRVRNHCAIELALDKAIHTLRTRVVFSPSQAGLRLSYPGSASPRGRRRRVRSSDGTYFHRTVSATRDGPVHVRPLRHPEAPTFVVEEHLQTADSSDSGEEGTLNVKPPLRRRNTPPPRIAMPPSFTQTHQNPFYLFMTPSQGTSPLESKKKKTAGGDGYMECSGSKSPRRHMRRKSADAAYILAMTKAER